MKDTSHLVALYERLSRENARLSNATNDTEKVFRQVAVDQAKREVKGEMMFLGLSLSEEQLNISDDDLLAELIV